MGNEFLFMIIFICIILISLRNAHILIGARDAAAAASSVRELNSLKQEVNGAIIEKVSGEDEKEKQETYAIENFRNLLGLRNFEGHSLSKHGLLSPSPAPSPSLSIHESQPPSHPVKHVHHPPLHPRFSSIPPLHKLYKNSNRGRVRRILIAVFVSFGSVLLLLLALGLVWFLRKHRKRCAKTAPTAWTNKKGRLIGRSKYVSPQNSVSKKVRFNPHPGMDLFYLNSLEVDLQQENSGIKQCSEDTGRNFSNGTLTLSPMSSEIKEESDRAVIRSEAESISSANSPTELLSVGESDGEDASSSGDRIIPVDDQFQSSDDESFHSLVDSQSSFRHSFASASEILEITTSSSKAINKNSRVKILTSEMNGCISPPTEASASPSCPPPPPPPPPPPLTPVHYPTPSSLSNSKKASKVLNSSSLRNILSPRKLDSVPEPPRLEKTEAGVPPPPLPPSLIGNTGILPNTPPPPPSMLPQFTPKGNDGAPLRKLKPLHWDKVRTAPNQTMVWDKLKSSSFELDEKMIESLFGYNLNNSMKSDDVKSKSPSPSKHVLEPKRLQNLTILLKAINVTSDRVCDALLQGEGLSLQQLEALVKIAPTNEEEEKLLTYCGNINELGSAENFVKNMLNIPLAFLRVEAMLYRETFEDEVIHLRKSFSMLEDACKELKSSRLFLKLLEAVLKTGNRMNVGTIRGGATAFKLDALLKLSDIKGTDGKTTLLHFVVQEMIRSEGVRDSETIVGRMNQRRKTIQEREEQYRKTGLDVVSGLTNELCNVKKTAAVDMDVLESSVSNLSEGMAKLKGVVQTELLSDSESEKFVSSMVAFMKHGEKELKQLEEEEHGVLQHVKEVTEYFHGSLSKDEANPLRIFVIVRDFLGMLDLVCKEMRNSKMSSIPNHLAPFRLG